MIRTRSVPICRTVGVSGCWVRSIVRGGCPGTLSVMAGCCGSGDLGGDDSYEVGADLSDRGRVGLLGQVDRAGWLSGDLERDGRLSPVRPAVVADGDHEDDALLPAGPPGAFDEALGRTQVAPDR